MTPFSQAGAEVFVPDGRALEDAWRRITHLGIGAHQDDLEFMAYHGILEGFSSSENSFGGVVCTNGAGSARSGPYAGCSDLDLRRIRREEQRTAARIGRYGMMVQLDHPTADLKKGANLEADLQKLLSRVHPQVVYTHNPADKHETHLLVTVAVIRALRAMPENLRPSHVYGCEVWRSLDWINDPEKTILDVSGRAHMAAALNGVFDSQIAGGKRYDLATEGRRRANATYLTAHATDSATHLAFAMDLTPLIRDPHRDVVEYTMGFVDRFRQDVERNLHRALEE